MSTLSLSSKIFSIKSLLNLSKAKITKTIQTYINNFFTNELFI